ncbi:hypothetical protein SD70_01355 [Gordoniibacillus kamchatkensis]|uniref:Cytosolic protein n=1 Tax=Gordoniibacillus kamchatkensis TaxID=1590651 RepID=A0ABR5AMG1_9BACL|nr:hypothetical protein [Paenibacillus sp. VKM B-2647]KIL42225.1 hypothetical protein SD70_01355 [Paenibacillus sp. VKM B-2647]
MALESAQGRRQLHDLSTLGTSAWSDEELRYHHHVMSELSPWLNAQGVHIHGQIIQEIERRGGLKR